MRARHTEGWTRRRFLGGLILAGTVGLFGLYPRPAVAEPPARRKMALEAIKREREERRAKGRR